MNKYWKLSENKCLEIELHSWPKEATWSYFDFGIQWTSKGDHAGFKIDFQVYRIDFILTVYDRRHWNWEDDCWDGEEEGDV